jgi:16S rRNA (cytidine1402-2'-O)-methyltransferase
MTNHPQKAPLGTLWMAATTLGDMRDIPLRSLELLRTCPFLVFEEDKQARQFLKAAGVQRQWMRYTEQREAFTLEELERELKEGNDALYMSDQGTPGLADPGRDLVDVALRIGANLRVVPGPSSLTATISVCPIDCRRFQFVGFPPRDESERELFLRQHLDHPWPSIIFDTPYRMRQFFETLEKVLHGTDRKVFVGVDISGEHEEFWWGTIEIIFKKVSALTEKRNYVVIVEGNGQGFVSRKMRPQPSNQVKPRPEKLGFKFKPRGHSGKSTHKKPKPTGRR